MSYIDSNLLPGEQVLTRATIHPLGAFGPAIGWIVVWLIVGLVVALGAVGLGIFLIIVGLLTAIPLAIGGYIRLTTSEYALTSRRVIAKEGMIKRRSFDVMLAKVEGVGVDQGVGGRLFGYGSIVVSGTGGSKEPFKAIAEPFAFRSAVHAKLEELGMQN